MVSLWTTSHVQFSGVADISSETHHNDLVLPKMSDQQRTPQRSLQAVLCPLDRSVADAQAEVKVQKPQRQSTASQRREDGREESHVDVPRESPLGGYNAYNKDCFQGIGSRRYSWERSGSFSVASQTIPDFHRGDRHAHRGGSQDLAELEKFASIQYAVDARDVQTDGEPCGEGVFDSIFQSTYSWTSQQVASLTKSGECNCKEGSRLGQGVDSLHIGHQRENQGACSALPAVQSRPPRGTQSEASRAFRHQGRDECSISVSSWSKSACSRSAGGSGYRGGDGGFPRCNSRSGNGQSYRPDRGGRLKGKVAKPVKPFRGAASPSKVAQVHLKIKQELREGKDSKKEDK